MGIAEGRWLSGVGYTLLALVAASLAFGLALTTAERLYYSGWAATRAVAHRKRAPHPPRRAAAAPLADLGARYLPPAVGAIVVKDWTMLRRDLRNLSQLVTPLVLGVVYAVMLFRTGRLLAAKFLAAYLPALALGWSFVGILALLQRGGLAPSALWFSLAADALCLGAVTGIYLAFGIAGARPDWEDPQQMIGSVTVNLALLSAALALLVGLALFAGTQVGLVLLRWPLLAGQLVGLVLGGVFCLACTLVPLRLVPLRLVRDRVARLGEN